MPERAAHKIFIDGAGVVRDKMHSGLPDIIDPNLILNTPRNGTFLSPDKENSHSPTAPPPTIIEPQFDPNKFDYLQAASPVSTPLSETDSSQDQVITNTEIIPEKPEKVHWVKQALLNFEKATNQEDIPLQVELLKQIKNPIIKASLFRKHQSNQDIQEEIRRYLQKVPKPKVPKVNYFGLPTEAFQPETQPERDQDAKNYTEGWMRITAVLGFISETVLTPEDRRLIYELYEAEKIPKHIAMVSEQNFYQADPKEFYKRIDPYLRPYRLETIHEDLKTLFKKNKAYRKRYGNVGHEMMSLYHQGKLPLNFILLPLEEFDELVSMEIAVQDIRHFDYLNRANKIMEAMSAEEMAKVFQIIRRDPKYNSFDRDSVRRRHVARAIKKVKGPLLERARLTVVDTIKALGNRLTNRL